MPASTSLSSTLVSTAVTSVSSVTGFTVMFAFLNTAAAVTPHGTAGAQIATLTAGLANEATAVTLAGLAGGTAISMVFLAKVIGLDASPAFTTVAMLPGAAEANTSAGA